jgi:hypothetical protein
MTASKLVLCLSIFFSLATAAHAEEGDQLIACGTGKEKGPESAEVGLVYGLDATHFYVHGKEIDSNDYDVVGRDGGYYVTVNGHGSGDQKFSFSEKQSEMQAYSIPIKGPEKKVGKVLACKWSAS